MPASSSVAIRSEQVKYDLEGREYKAVFEVQFATPALASVLAVRAALPPLGSAFTNILGDYDANATVTGYGKISAVGPKGERSVWHAEVFYSTRQKDNCATRQWDNPLDKPAEVSLHFNDVYKPLTEDLDGDDVVNSAGDLLEGEEYLDGKLVLRIRKNQASLNLDDIRQNLYGRNNGTFFGVAQGYWQWVGFSCEERWLGDCGTYYPCEYEFELDPDKHERTFVDMGLNEKDGTDRVAIRDKFHAPISAPVPLDGSGNKLDAGDPLVDTPNSPHVAPNAALYDFSNLSIPTNFAQVNA